jgi:hypothetical protein
MGAEKTLRWTTDDSGRSTCLLHNLHQLFLHRRLQVHNAGDILCGGTSREVTMSARSLALVK